MMKSVIELEVLLPPGRVAALMTDPRHNTQWMDDVERIETISGDSGMPGSTYRIVPKQGDMVFVATVISRDLPNASRLKLDATHVSVDVRVAFRAIAPGRTLLVSEETFNFKGLLHKLLGVFAHGAIRKVHRRHIEAFKRFAEAHG